MLPLHLIFKTMQAREILKQPGACGLPRGPIQRRFLSARVGPDGLRNPTQQLFHTVATGLHAATATESRTARRTRVSRIRKRFSDLKML